MSKSKDSIIKMDDGEIVGSTGSTTSDTRMSGTANEASAREAARRVMINDAVLPVVQKEFGEFPQLQTAVACVAQYYNDEANDAVHCRVAFSENASIDLAKCGYGKDWDGNAKKDVYPNRDYYEGVYGGGWDDNGEAIPLFAAFCKEGASQDDDGLESHNPYVVFRRVIGLGINTGLGISVEIVGVMLRPWLDGVRPEWEREEGR